MKTVVISEHGGPEVLQLVSGQPRPNPGGSELRIQVKAVGLNRADLLQRRGLYPPPPGFPPEIPGMEYAGEVVEVGQDCSLRQVGDRVMGIIGGGSYAEELTVHERESMRVPADMTWERAAAIPEAFLTAYDALEQCELKSGETVLIHAVGSGVGLAGLQLAHAMGCVTLGSSRTASKLEAAAKYGLDHPILVEDDSFASEVRSLTKDRGVHVIADFVGARYLKDNIKVLAHQGRMVVIGLMGGAKAELPLHLLLSKRLTIRGTTLRARPLEEKIRLARAFEERIVPQFEQRILAPVLHEVLSMEEVVAAHQMMEGNQNFGKIVLVWE